MMRFAGFFTYPHVHFVQFLGMVAERNPHGEYTTPTVARDEAIFVKQGPVHVTQRTQTPHIKGRPKGTPTEVNGRWKGRRWLPETSFDFVVFGRCPFGRIGRFYRMTGPAQIVFFQPFLGTVARMCDPFGRGRAGHVDGGVDELLVGVVVVLMAIVQGRQESVQSLLIGGGG